MIASPLVTVVSLLLLFCVGCGSKPEDVTKDPAYGNFKTIVGTWKTKTPLKLVEIEFNGDKVLNLIYGDVTTTRAHRELYELPAGSEIRIERLIFTRGGNTDFLDITGSLPAGSYSGKRVNIDSSLFMPVDLPLYAGCKGTPTQYYSTWHGATHAKPDWVATPDKLERLH